MLGMMRDAVASPNESSAHAPAPATARTPTGRFAAGGCGNPKGRPRGSRNKATQARVELLDGEVEALTGKMIALALGGDVKAMTFCMGRILPTAKERQFDLELPPIVTLTDVADAQGTVIEAASKGEIDPRQAMRLANIIDRQRRAIQSRELEQRIARIEEHLTKALGYKKQPINPDKRGSRQSTEALSERTFRIMAAVAQTAI
jgi:hypothetical protein